MFENNKILLPVKIILLLIILISCSRNEYDISNEVRESSIFDEPINIKHSLGTTVIDKYPNKIAVLDMNSVDFLDQLGISISGMPKDFIPHFLSKYENQPRIKDLGALVQPNLESVHKMSPDLIIMSTLHTAHYQELNKIAPTVYFNINYQNSKDYYINEIKDHITLLGKIFNKQNLAIQKIDELEKKVAEIKNITNNRQEKALIIMHNNGSFSAFGVQSRYGFIYDMLGVKPTYASIKSGSHGQPISSEFIQKINPDIIYIIDRTAVMDKKSVITAEQIYNPLISQTNAWKNNKVIFVDPDAWYTTAASITSLRIIMDDIVKGYEK